MKHWLMQRVMRNKDGEIISRQKPKTVGPDLGKSLKKIEPNAWEILDKEYEVPDDWRGTGGSPPTNWTEEKVQESFYPKPAAKPEPAKR